MIDLPAVFDVSKYRPPSLLPVILYLDDSTFYCMLDSKTSILVMSNKYLIFLLIYSRLNYFLFIINSLLSKEACNCKVKVQILGNSNEHLICLSSPLWLSVYGRGDNCSYRD